MGSHTKDRGWTIPSPSKSHLWNSWLGWLVSKLFWGYKTPYHLLFLSPKRTTTTHFRCNWMISNNNFPIHPNCCPDKRRGRREARKFTCLQLHALGSWVVPTFEFLHRVTTCISISPPFRRGRNITPHYLSPRLFNFYTLWCCHQPWFWESSNTTDLEEDVTVPITTTTCLVHKLGSHIIHDSIRKHTVFFTGPPKLRKASLPTPMPHPSTTLLRGQRSALNWVFFYFLFYIIRKGTDTSFLVPFGYCFNCDGGSGVAALDWREQRDLSAEIRSGKFVYHYAP